jgi:hypothetical protein
MKLPNVLSEGFLKAMPQSERKRLGRVGMTNAEANQRRIEHSERELQRQVHNWLLGEGIYFVNPRMDRKTTTSKGTPDFIACVDGRVDGLFLGIECKADRNTLTSEQAREANHIRMSKGRFIVAFCLNDVIQAIGELRAK